MKKKPIEQIPWMIKKAPKNLGKESIMFKAAVHDIGGTKTLIVDTWLDGPKYRICITDEDYANYDPEQKKWNTRILDNLFVYPQSRFKYNIDRKSEGVITGFNGKQSSCGNWNSRIDTKQRNINWARTNRAEVRNHKRIEERMKTVPKEPKGLKSFLQKIIPRHLIYTQPFLGKKETSGTCSNCGNEITLIKGESHIGKKMKCPHCKCTAELKRTSDKYKLDLREEAILFQKTEEGFVERHYQVYKNIQKGSEKVSWWEKVRIFWIDNFEFVYFEKGYQNSYWDDKNIPGMNNITYKSGYVFESNLEKELEDTPYKYSMLAAVCKERKIRPNHYLIKYKEMPELEMLVKVGLVRLANEVGCLKNPYAKNPWERFGIDKEKSNRLRAVNGGIRTLHVLQNETQYHHTDILKFIDEHMISRENVQLVEEYTTMTKIKNYSEKKVGYKNQEETLRHYFDYIALAIELEYDLDNQIMVFPKDLRMAHDEALLRKDIAKGEKSAELANKMYPDIRKMRRRINQEYGFESESLIMRAPMDAGEIVMEGRILHHCVGRGLEDGTGYIAEMHREESVILVLRKKNEPKTPFYTIEIKNKKIIQWYGLNDGKPEIELVKPFIEAYEKKLKGEYDEEYHARAI